MNSVRSPRLPGSFSRRELETNESALAATGIGASGATRPQRSIVLSITNRVIGASRLVWDSSAGICEISPDKFRSTADSRPRGRPWSGIGARSHSTANHDRLHREAANRCSRAMGIGGSGQGGCRLGDDQLPVSCNAPKQPCHWRPASPAPPSTSQMRGANSFVNRR